MAVFLLLHGVNPPIHAYATILRLIYQEKIAFYARQVQSREMVTEGASAPNLPAHGKRMLANYAIHFQTPS